MNEPTDPDVHGAALAALTANELYDRSPCGLLSLAENGQIEYVNATFAHWMHRSGDDLAGSSLFELLAPGARIFYETRLLPLALLNGSVSEIALSFTPFDGEPVSALVNATVDRTGTHPLLHLAVFDAGQRQDYERQLISARRSAEASEARTRALQNATNAFGEANTVEQIADALAESARGALDATAVAVYLDDHEPPLAGGTAPLDLGLLPILDRNSAVPDALRTFTVRGEESNDALEASLRAARLEAVLIAPLLREGTRIGTLACYFAREPEPDEHITELIQALCRQAAQTVARLQLQAQLATIALYDSLTGLANRALLRTHITATVAAAATEQQALALIFVDLDDFKAVNDELDHSAGDTVLKLVAARLTAAVRSDDLVCRYGGDEFIVVCRNTEQNDAAAVAERIRVAVRQPLYSDGWQRTITASVGVTVHTASPTHMLTGPELLRVADKAMYRSKDRGKDQVSIISFA